MVLNDKQRSDVIDIPHVIFTMENKDQEYSTGSDASSVILESETTVPQVSNNNSDIAITSTNNSSTSDNSLVSILRPNIKNKVAGLLQKTNLTEKELLNRVKLMKRKTKDKRKRTQLRRVFSHKNSAFSSSKRLNQLKSNKNTNKQIDTASSTSGSATSELESDANYPAVISALEKDCSLSRNENTKKINMESSTSGGTTSEMEPDSNSPVVVSGLEKDCTLRLLNQLESNENTKKIDGESPTSDTVTSELKPDSNSPVAISVFDKDCTLRPLNQLKSNENTKKFDGESPTSDSVSSELEPDSNSPVVVSGLEKDCTLSLLNQLESNENTKKIDGESPTSDNVTSELEPDSNSPVAISVFDKDCTLRPLNQLKSNENTKKIDGESPTSGSVTSDLESDSKSAVVISAFEEDCSLSLKNYENTKKTDMESSKSGKVILHLEPESVLENDFTPEEIKIEDAFKDYEPEEKTLETKSPDTLFSILEKITEFNKGIVKNDFEILEKNINKAMAASSEKIKSNNNDIKLKKLPIKLCGTIDLTEEKEKNLQSSQLSEPKDLALSNSADLTVDIDDILDEMSEAVPQISDSFKSSAIAELSSQRRSEAIIQINKKEKEINTNHSDIKEKQLQTISVADDKISVDPLVECEQKNDLQVTEKEVQVQGKENIETVNEIEKDKMLNGDTTDAENSNKIEETSIQNVKSDHDDEVKDVSNLLDKEEMDNSGEPIIELNNTVAEEKKDETTSTQTASEEELKKNSISSDKVEELMQIAQKSIPAKVSINDEKNEESQTLIQSEATHEEKDIDVMKSDSNSSRTIIAVPEMEIPQSSGELVVNEEREIKDRLEVFEMGKIAQLNSEEIENLQKSQEGKIKVNNEDSEIELKSDDEQELGAEQDVEFSIESKVHSRTREGIISPIRDYSSTETFKTIILEKLQKFIDSDSESDDIKTSEESRDVEIKNADYYSSLPSTSSAHAEEGVGNVEEECNSNIYAKLYGDDDIRNKIKEQLQLLRQVNRRPSLINKDESTSSQSTCNVDDLYKPSTSKDVTPLANVDDQPSTSKANLNQGEDDALPSTSTSEKELDEDCATIVPVPAKEDLNSVLLSNEGELMIVNVVGGYFSDHEDNDQSVAVDSTEASEEENKTTGDQKSKKISITDKLLIELSQENFHSIKPTKTTDITKIKGWRSKQFNVDDEEAEEATVEDSIENGEEILALPAPETEATINSIENPIPGTSSNYLPPVEVPEINSEHVSDMSTQPDNILVQGEKENEEKNKKSAFISDELETFLNNNRQLNISYEIPKLVAEEAISKPKFEMPLSNNNYLQVVEKPTYKPKGSKKGKPKTLAEKRRMLELDRKNQLMHDMTVREDIYLKELAYCKKRNLTEKAEDIRHTLMAEEVPISRACWLMAVNSSICCTQFITTNGKRIRIAGSTGGDDLIAPKIFSKHVLCNIDERKICDTSKYKPGPLSKKHKLLKPIVQRNWESHVLKMPRIKLEVYPEYRKPLPLIAQQYLQLCRADQFLISEDWARLAVTAVQTKKKASVKKFECELPYARNQNKLLVRRPVQKLVVNPVKPISTEKIPNKFAHSNAEERIKEVINDMITCIENQELDKLILKADPDSRETVSSSNSKLNKPSSPVHDPLLHHTIIKRPNVKRNRSTLELRRLNVQVIEVDVKDDDAIPENCDKDYCKLGCICRSLRGSMSGVPEHCGREGCMFKCKCSFETLPKGHRSITLPAGTDILSASTMVRLQDEAKKNLAKVEREFTQTVIKANNQTIMVGGGARDRTRRIPKVPKKFNNFAVGVGRGNDEFDELSPEKLSEKVINRKSISESVDRSPESKRLIPIWNKTEGPEMKKKHLMSQKRATRCIVLLEKMDLNHAIPWCMVHNLYKCYCGGKALPTVRKAVPLPKHVEGQTKKAEDSEYITYNPRFSSRPPPPPPPPPPEPPVSDKFCARTKAVPANLYLTRNKSAAFKEKYAKMAKRQKPRSPQTSDDEWLPDFVPPAPPPSKKLRQDSSSNDSLPFEQDLLVPMKKKSRMNQTIVYPASYHPVPLQAEDPLALPEINIPEEQPIPPQASHKEIGVVSSNIISSTTLIDYDKSYTGFITPSKDFVKHFYKMLDLKESSKIHQIRLLEWQTMERRHKGGQLQVWFNTKRYNNIILTEDRRRPSPSHMNIKHFINFPSNKFKLPDIISSLLKNTLPGKALEPTETYTIILYDGTHWEARGTIVLSEAENVCRKKLLNKPTPSSLLNPATPRPILPKPNFNLISTPSMSIELINNEGTPISTNLPEFIGSSEESNESNRSLVRKCIHVPLPTGSKFNKWFSLILTNNFYSLRITFSNYCIKYTSLVDIVARAFKQQRTVIIRAPAEDYDGVDENFGIYSVPGCRDRIFFGPYDDHQIHGLETYRFVNGELINTKFYDKMSGNCDNKILGSWFKHTSTAPSLSDISQYVELPSNPELSPELTSTIDNPIVQPDFVDLTANDESDSDSSKIQEKIEAILTTDLSKKAPRDVPIQPVEERIKKAFVRKKNSTSVLKGKVERQLKRKSVDQRPTSEPTPKQAKVIDSINLEDDDQEMPVLQPFNNESLQSSSMNNKQMPVLTAPDPKDDEMSKKRLYVITNIPGVGYFELSFRKRKEKRKVLCITILGVTSLYPTINSAIQALHRVFKDKLFFMPSDLKVKFSIVDASEPPQMAKFSDEYLDGYYMISERGIFNVLYLTTADLECSEFSKDDLRNLMAHKCELLVRKNINILGTYLFSQKELISMDQDDILDLAPVRIKKLEKDEQDFRHKTIDLHNKQQLLINKINCLMRVCPDNAKEIAQKNMQKVLNSKTRKILAQNKNAEKSKSTIDASLENPPMSDKNRTTLTNITTNKTVLLTDEMNRTLIAQANLKSAPSTTQLSFKNFSPQPAITSPSKAPSLTTGTIVPVATKLSVKTLLSSSSSAKSAPSTPQSSMTGTSVPLVPKISVKTLLSSSAKSAPSAPQSLVTGTSVPLAPKLSVKTLLSSSAKISPSTPQSLITGSSIPPAISMKTLSSAKRSPSTPQSLITGSSIPPATKRTVKILKSSSFVKRSPSAPQSLITGTPIPLASKSTVKILSVPPAAKLSVKTSAKSSPSTPASKHSVNTPSSSPVSVITSPSIAQSMITGTPIQLHPSKNLPAGKRCQIVDGKIILLDNPGPPSSQKSSVMVPVKIVPKVNLQNKTELLIPIAGLPSPVAVTVPSDKKKLTSNLLCKLPSSILIKKSPPVVDLTDD